MPIKCPVAPLEFCFLADWYFTERGIRDQVADHLRHPARRRVHQADRVRARSAACSPSAASSWSPSSTPARSTAPAAGSIGYDEREVPFDLAVVIPLHGGADVRRPVPGLGDALDFVPTDEHTLQSKAAPNVFAIGDAATVPASKAGSVTHFEGEVLVENIERFLAGEPLEATLRRPRQLLHRDRLPQGPAHRLQLRHEPLPGHFPGPVGLPLLKESRLNHLGKLLFQWVYWHSLLPGRDIPGLTLGHADRRQAPDLRSAEGGPDMPTATIAGTDVDLNDEGFFTDPEQWTEDMAPELAAAEGIDELTDRHWQVIRFMRKEYFEKGTGPTVRVLGKTSGVSVKELYQLFPKGPAKIAATIAGIPKPRGCI